MAQAEKASSSMRPPFSFEATEEGIAAASPRAKARPLARDGRKRRSARHCHRQGLRTRLRSGNRSPQSPSMWLKGARLKAEMGGKGQNRLASKRQMGKQTAARETDWLQSSLSAIRRPPMSPDRQKAANALECSPIHTLIEAADR